MTLPRLSEDVGNYLPIFSELWSEVFSWYYRGR